MPVRIVEWKLPYTWWTWIEIDTNKVISLLLREEDNLIMVNSDNEVYTDLQLESWLTPSSDFPVWVTVWKVLQTDWWAQNWLILNWKTTSWDYARWIYANDWKLYFDNGTWTWKKVYYSTDVDTLLTNLRNEVYQYFIKWSDFERDEQNNANVMLSLTTQTTPTEDFTVSAPSTVRAWQEYVLRVISTETAYVMTLWQWIVNPKQVDINLHTHTTDTYVFLALDDWTLELQPIVSEWANPNDWILTIQKNGTTVATFTANQATNATANITVPTVVDDLTTQSSTNALSANQWYELKWMIDDLAGFGKFLSLWNATTWMPISFPLATPYTYSTWDYFVVEVVSNATPPVNYRPNGSSYTWTASSTAEADELEVWDVYVYDGTVWLLQSNHWKTVSFWNIAWDPYDNTNLWNALNAKQDTLIAWTNITIAADGKTISANNTTYSSATTATAWIVKLWSDTQISEAIQSPGWASNKTYPVQLNSSGQMWVNVPRANTTYSAWTWISINGSNAISNTWVTSFNGSTWAITWVNSVNWNTWAVTVNDVKVSASAPVSPTEWMAWYDTTNDQLKVYDWTNWNVTGKEYNAGEWISIWNYNSYSAMQWPAPTWYHIPSKNENVALVAAMTALWIDTSEGGCMKTYLKMPFAGYRAASDAAVSQQGSRAYYRSSTVNTAAWVYDLFFRDNNLDAQDESHRSIGASIRCFKDTPVTPNSNWTTLYAWTWDAWIFHNTTDWLISISSDWTTWITIQDKNLWATVVYNDGDALAETNCWKYYQRWNNYGFAWTGAITTSSTQVDASNYWPWNYYSSSTFITVNTSPYDWSSVQNDNLWWWVTWVVTLNNAINNTWVLSVNWQTWDVTVAGWIQNDTTWTTTTVTAIRCGTQAEYNALGSYSQSIIYHIY